jgi:sec-independent protein translocase protein TatA
VGWQVGLLRLHGSIDFGTEAWNSGCRSDYGAQVTTCASTQPPVIIMPTFGPFELIVIFLVVLLLFGAKRIPEIARGIGRGIREFKDATTDISRELQINDERPRVQAPRDSNVSREDIRRPEPEPAERSTEDKASA